MRYSTRQAAKLAGVGFRTLNRWIAERKVKAPKRIQVGVVVVRLWSKADVERIRRYKAKHYGAGRGRRTNLVRKRRKRA